MRQDEPFPVARRVGGLEISPFSTSQSAFVARRVGGLEMQILRAFPSTRVARRVGGLEKFRFGGG